MLIENNNVEVATTKNTPEKLPYKRKTKMDKYKMWVGESRFVSIDPPTTLEDNFKNRFKIVFRYFDPIDKKIKKKTMTFGRKGVEYLIDHGNEQQNKIWLSKQRGYYTPFHKNFWVNCILCSEKNILKAYNKTLSILLV